MKRTNMIYLRSLLSLVMLAGCLTNAFGQTGDSLPTLDLMEQKAGTYKTQLKFLEHEKEGSAAYFALRIELAQLRADLIQFLNNLLEQVQPSEAKIGYKELKRTAEIYEEIDDRDRAKNTYRRLFSSYPDLVETDIKLTRLGKTIQKHIRLEPRLSELAGRFNNKLSAHTFLARKEGNVLKELDRWKSLYNKFAEAAIENEKLLIELDNAVAASRNRKAVEAIFRDVLSEVYRQADSGSMKSAPKIKEKVRAILSDYGWTGHFHYSKGEYRTAISELERFLKTHPQSIDSRLLIAASRIQLRDYDQAREQCKKILNITPDQTLKTKVEKIIIYTYLQEQRYSEAAAVAGKAEKSRSALFMPSMGMPPAPKPGSSFDDIIPGLLKRDAQHINS